MQFGKKDSFFQIPDFIGIILHIFLIVFSVIISFLPKIPNFFVFQL